MPVTTTEPTCRLEYLAELGIVIRICNSCGRRRPEVADDLPGLVWQKINKHWCERCRKAGETCARFCFESETLEAAECYIASTAEHTLRELGAKRAQRLERERWALKKREATPEGAADDEWVVRRALAHLNQIAPLIGRVMDLKLNHGESHEAIAHALAISTRTVERKWRRGKEILRDYLTRKRD